MMSDDLDDGGTQARSAGRTGGGGAAGGPRRSLLVVGRVVAGHGVASGRNPDSPFPSGTIELQQPVFAALGLDLGHLHPATINVDIAPHRYRLGRARHTYEQVRWTDVHGPETFSFLTCGLSRAGDPRMHQGWVYLPHPETKPMHEQPATVLELLMPFVTALHCGDRVTLHLDPAEITIS
jgi:hypothetical protein